MTTQNSNKSSQNTFNAFRGAKIPDFESVMSTHRKNLDVLKTAQKSAFEAAKTMSQSHMSYVKQSMEDFKTHMQDMMGSKNLEEKVQAHTQRLKNSFEQAASYHLGLNEIFHKTREDVTNVFSQRIKEGVSEVKEKAKKAKASATETSGK